MPVLDRLRSAAEETPARRERHIDLLRAVSIWAVVVGHWMVAGVLDRADGLDVVIALGVLDWTHPLTWVFQVMPVFFLIGGYANAAALESHERADGDALGWVLGRYDRLLRPTTAFLAMLVVAVAVARLVGVDAAVAADAAWAATVPLWFLTAYLAVVALAPWALRAHRRWGFAVPLLLAGVVGVGDLARLVLGLPYVGDANYLVAWLAIHQVGFAWRDGRLPARPRVGTALAGAGILALVALTVVGPYPVSMVGVPGEALQNTAPPTLALLALAGTQIGLALAFRDRASRWLERRGVWMAVLGVNAVVLTVFLWHMAAAVVAAVLLYPTGVLPTVPVDSAAWLGLRLPWVAACLVVLAGFVLLFGRLELSVPGARRGARVGPGAASWATGLAILATLVGMLGIGVAGRGVHGPLGLPGAALAAYGVGAAVLAVVGRRAFPR